MDQTNILTYNKKENKIQILAKEIETKSITDLITTIKDKLMAFSDSLDNNYSIYKLNLYKKIIGKKEKIFTKEEDALEILKLYEIIHKDFNKEKQKCNLNFIDDDTLIIDYNCVKSLCELIIEILKQIHQNKDYSYILSNILRINKINEIADKKIWDSSIYIYIQKCQSIQSIIFSISSLKTDKEVKVEYFFLLYHFFQFFFRKVNSFKIDLNVQKINEIYHIDQSPYKIIERKINELGEKYKNIFLVNYILSQIINEASQLEILHINLDESYLNEINYIFQKFYEKNIDPKENSLIFKNISLINSIKDLRCEFNCLDPLLFKSFNDIIFSHRSVEFIDLTLFPVRKFLSFRKILFNYESYLNINNMKQKNYDIKDLYIDYQTYDKSHNPILLEEKIPKYLYDLFKENLLNLKIGLNTYITNLKSFKLDISPYLILLKYDEFIVQIILLIYNIIQVSQYSETLKNLTIRAHNVYIPINFISKLKKLSDKEIDFSDSLVQTFKFSIYNLFHFISLNNFPHKNLENLSLENLSINEFKELVEYLKLNREKYSKLINLEISIDFSIDVISKNIFLNFFKSSIPSSLKMLQITFSNDIDLIDITSMIKEFNQDNLNENSNVKFILNCNIVDFINYRKDLNKITDIVKRFFNSKKIKYRLNEINLSFIQLDIFRFKTNDLFYSIIKGFEDNLNSFKENKKDTLMEIFSFMDGGKYSLEINLNS